MSIEETQSEIRKINQKFYEALTTADISLMDEIWIQGDNVQCVHPGWPLLLGWKEVRESWENIFQSGGLTDIEISNIFIDVVDDTAWLNCTEKLSYMIGEQAVITLAQTTNIFELTGSTWKMVLHHASPMPMPPTEKEIPNLQ